MTTITNPDPTGAQAQGSAQASTAGAVGSAGNAGYTSQGFEGSLKQASDVNTEEALAVVQALNPKMAEFFSNLLAANAKRTYDQSQSTDLMTQYGDVTQRNTLNNLATQALQNAIETANMVGKQAVRHSDIAIDRQWNVNETDALAAAVAAAVAKALNK